MVHKTGALHVRTALTNDFLKFGTIRRCTTLATSTLPSKPEIATLVHETDGHQGNVGFREDG